MLELYAFFTFVGLCLGLLLTLIIRKIYAKSRIMQQKQLESVYKKYLNSSTKAFMQDVMTVNVGGAKVTDLRESLFGAFPNLIEDLEKQRVKNPEAWRRTIQFWLPLIMAKQQGQQKITEGLGAAAGPAGMGLAAAAPGLMQGFLGMQGGKPPGT